MYRQYEDPRKLEQELDAMKAKFSAPGYEMDEYDYEALESLKERVNFAWQDEEYDEMCAMYGY